MKNAKRNAIITLLIIALCVAGLIYMVMNGVGAEKTGRAEDIPLGLDLQGGVSVTYQIEDEDPDSSAINATKEKLQKRVDGYSTDGSVYLEGDDRISVEIPLDTSKYDANQILDDLGRPSRHCADSVERAPKKTDTVSPLVQLILYHLVPWNHNSVSSWSE